METKLAHKRGLFSSESVSPGHPDSANDWVADSIVDACLAGDKSSRCAIEMLSKDDFVIVGGEVTTKSDINVEEIVKRVYKTIGYEFTPRVLNILNTQSPDIALGTNDDVDGAGDQGIMFGYANRETSDYYPLAISIAHALIRKAYTMFQDGEFPGAKADMKSQVTVDYDKSKDGSIVIDNVVLAIQHSEDINLDEFKEFVKKNIIEPVFSDYNVVNDDYRVLINGTGRFTIGGPIGDAGVVGRKIVVDQYGGYCPVGGGAFSGKDSTKVDRSAAYAARHIAKNIVAADLADECQVQLAYCIGVSQPVSVNIYTFGTGKLSEEELESKVKGLMSLSPKAISERYGLRRPIFAVTQLIGHFGQSGKRVHSDEDFISVPWENLDLVEEMSTWK